jgi:hypothetical protein
VRSERSREGEHEQGGRVQDEDPEEEKDESTALVSVEVESEEGHDEVLAERAVVEERVGLQRELTGVSKVERGEEREVEEERVEEEEERVERGEEGEVQDDARGQR